MERAAIKDQARRLIDLLPNDATWEDLQAAINLQQAIETGLTDSVEGRTVPFSEARHRFGLNPE